jgi:histone H3/H4
MTRTIYIGRMLRSPEVTKPEEGVGISKPAAEAVAVALDEEIAALTASAAEISRRNGHTTLFPRDFEAAMRIRYEDEIQGHIIAHAAQAVDHYNASKGN